MQMIRILVVDDDRDVLEMTANFFNIAGMEVHCADNGETALMKIQDINFSALITDYHMPGMNGIELAVKAREIKPSIPVILISGKTSEEMSRLAEQAGVVRVLSKPLHPEKILTQLNEVIIAASS